MANFALCQIPNTVGCYVPTYLPIIVQIFTHSESLIVAYSQTIYLPTFLRVAISAKKYSSKVLLKNIDIENTKCLTAKKFSFSIGIVSLSTDFIYTRE
jgi:hypothetical protein